MDELPWRVYRVRADRRELVARFADRREADAYAREFIEGDMTGYEVTNADGPARTPVVRSSPWGYR